MHRPGSHRPLLKLLEPFNAVSRECWSLMSMKMGTPVLQEVTAALGRWGSQTALMCIDITELRLENSLILDSHVLQLR